VDPNSEGYKELVLEHDGNEYTIRHYYKKGGSTKSYVEINGSELNPTGGIRNFEKVIEEHLGMTRRAYQVYRIGTNVSNFIDLPGKDRKLFLNDIVPDITEMVQGFKVAKQKHLDAQRNISVHTKLLKELPSREVITSSIDSTNAILEATTAKLKGLEKKVIELESFLKQEHVVQGLEYQSVINESVSSNNRVLEEASKHISTLISDYPVLDKYSTQQLSSTEKRHTEDQIAGLQGKLETLEPMLKEVSDLTARCEDLKKSALDQQHVLDLVKEYEDTVAQFEDERARLRSIDKIGRQHEALTRISSDAISNIERLLGQLYDIVTDFQGYPSCIELLEQYKTMNQLTEYHKKVSSELNLARIARDKNQSKLTILENQVKIAEGLSKRPKACRIDSCGFIKEALRMKDAPEHYTKARSDAQALVNEVKELEATLEVVNDTMCKFNSLDAAVRNVLNMVETKHLVLVSSELVKTNVVYNLVTLPNRRVRDLVDLTNENDYIEVCQSLEEAKNRYNEVKASITDELVNQSTVESTKASLESKVKDLKALREKVADNEGVLEATVKTISKYTNKVNVLTRMTESFTLKEEAESNLIKYSNEQKKLDELMAEVRQVNNEVSETTTHVKNVQHEVNNLNAELDQYKSKLSQYDNTVNVINSSTERANKVKLVREALDPTKGIPVYNLDNILGTIEDDTNKLLDIAFKGDYRIKFHMDESEFNILVSQHGNEPKGTVEDASQGETSILKLALSLSLIRQYGNGFTIVCLDELDALLDTNNRSRFVRILRDQVEYLGLTQVFIISHNQEFDHTGCDLVLFPRHNMLVTPGANVIHTFA